MNIRARLLLPLILVFTVSTAIISWNFYNSLEAAVRQATRAELDIFTESIIRQALRLEMVLEVATNALMENHLAIARSVAYQLDHPYADLSAETLTQISELLGIQEINIACDRGVIFASNFPEFVGFDYNRYDATRVYLPLTDGTLTELQEMPRLSVIVRPPIGELSLYTGIHRAGGGFYQFGFYAGVLLYLQEEVNIERAIAEAVLSHGGYGFVLNGGRIFAHPLTDRIGQDISGVDWHSIVTARNGFASISIDGVAYFAGFRTEGGHTVVGVIPELGYYQTLFRGFYRAVLFFVISLAVLILFIYVQAKRIAHEKEQERLDLKDFIASMTHDVKTPLSVLSLNLEALLGHAETHACNPECLRRSKVAYQKCLVLQRLIQNLFEVNSIESGRIAYNFKDTSLLQLLTEARTRYDDYLDEKGITLEISAAYDDATLSIDPLRIWSVFDNIIYNAARYTPSGGTITIHGRHETDRTIITLTDTGCGIPPENLPHIFDKFYKRSQSRGENDGDSGLGLYLVKNIMHGHGGSVTAASRIGEGTGITLEFKVKR